MNSITISTSSTNDIDTTNVSNNPEVKNILRMNTVASPEGIHQCHCMEYMVILIRYRFGSAVNQNQNMQQPIEAEKKNPMKNPLQNNGRFTTPTPTGINQKPVESPTVQKIAA